MAQQTTRAICILGMHRSGTSLLTRAVSLLGADVGNPDILMPPHETNPTGFWEHLEIVQIHKQILKAMNSSWDATRPLPHKWWTSTRLLPYRERLQGIIDRDFKDRPLWMWKDPRSCLLLPLWKQLLSEAGIELNCVIVVRNPLDVAVSLKKRDGISPEKSFRMWTLHTLNSLLYSQDRRRILIHYDRFLRDWESSLRRIATGLHIPWPDQDRELRAEMSRLIQPDLRHSRSSLQDLARRGKAAPLLLTAYRLCLIADRFPIRLSTPWMAKNVKTLCDRYRLGTPVMSKRPVPLQKVRHGIRRR